MEEDEYMTELTTLERNTLHKSKKMTKQKPLLQKLFKDYMNPLTGKINRDSIAQLAAEYEDHTGQNIADLSEELPLFCLILS